MYAENEETLDSAVANIHNLSNKFAQFVKRFNSFYNRAGGGRMVNCSPCLGLQNPVPKINAGGWRIYDQTRSVLWRELWKWDTPSFIKGYYLLQRFLARM